MKRRIKILSLSLVGLIISSATIGTLFFLAVIMTLIIKKPSFLEDFDFQGTPLEIHGHTHITVIAGVLSKVATFN